MDEIQAAVTSDSMTSRQGGVVAQSGAPPCTPAVAGAMSMELEMLVGSNYILSTDTLVRADHRSTARKYHYV